MKKSISKVFVCMIIFVLIGFATEVISSKLLVWLPLPNNHFEEFTAVGKIVVVLIAVTIMKYNYLIFKGSVKIRVIKNLLLFLCGIIVTELSYWFFLIFRIWIIMGDF